MTENSEQLSKIDIRDYKLNSPNIQLPNEYSLIRFQSIKNQHKVQSCTAYALSSILEYHNKGHQVLSTNFLYGFANTNKIGISVRDACEIAYKYGDVLESECPGNYERPVAHQKFTQYINASNIKNGLSNRIAGYYDCKTYRDIKYAIYNYGPVLGVLRWYEDCYVSPGGNLIYDKNKKQSYHTVVIYGWDEQGFLCQNSWGYLWGHRGCFRIYYKSKIIYEAKAIIVEPKVEDSALVKPQLTLPKPVYKAANKLLNLIFKKKPILK